jgi:hypothetical protein
MALGRRPVVPPIVWFPALACEAGALNQASRLPDATDVALIPDLREGRRIATAAATWIEPFLGPVEWSPSCLLCGDGKGLADQGLGWAEACF